MVETPWLLDVTHNDGGINDMAIDLYKLHATMRELGWEEGDEVIIKIAGTRTSGIHQTEGANPKWAPPFGTVTHNRDAQIVIENLSRRDLSKSTPMDEDELLAKFRVSSSGQLYAARQLEELLEPSPMVIAGGHPWLEIINWLRTNLSK